MIGRIYMRSFNKKVSFIESIPIIMGILFAIIIEIYRILNPMYGILLRGYNHLLAGIIMPYMFYILWFKEDYYKISNKYFLKNISNKDFSCLLYLIGSFIWELGQVIIRGYIQLDQYIFDLLGIGMIFLLFKYKEFKNKK